MKAKKIIAGVLSMALVLGIFSFSSVFASEPPAKVYVSKNGTNTNDGKTSETPVKTLSQACEMTGDGATIVVLDEVTYDVTVSHSTRTILGDTKEAVLRFGEDGNDMKLQGNLVIKNIVLDNQKEYGAVYTDNYSLIIGAGVSYQGTTNPVVVTGNGEKTRQFIINEADFEAGNIMIHSGLYSVVTADGKTPVAVSSDGKSVIVANETSSEKAKVYFDKNAKRDYSDYISYRKGLPNTFKKLNGGETLNVVYFGGSVTVGYGAGGSYGAPADNEKDTKSWRALLGKWLEEKYPGQINNFNEGLGESGTYMGSFRIERILDKYVKAGTTPDLFFIEYAINDYYALNSKTEDVRYDSASSQFETIVREIKKVNPNCDIVTVLVADRNTMAGAKIGNLHIEAKAHEDISKAYNIPSLKFGSAIANKVPDLHYANETWKKYFADGVHPTSAGYGEYYKCIEEFMTNSVLHADYVETEMPEVGVAVQSKTLFDGNRTVIDMTQELLTQSEGTGFKLNTETVKNEFHGSIQAATKGATFTYSFEGTETAILVNKWDATLFQIEVDGQAYSPTAGSLAHNPITLAKDLTPGTHKVKITTVEDNTIIYAIFTHDTSKTTLQGAGAENGNKKATLSLPIGTYSIKYYENVSVADIAKPVVDGLTFYGWFDKSGKTMEDQDRLLPGMKLTAFFWEKGTNINPDVNCDGYVNDADTQMLREILVGKSDVTEFDVNCDGECNVKDLVALKKFLTNIWQRDNDLSVNDL